MKPDKNTEYPESLITHDVEPKDNLNTKGKGQITHYPIQQRKRPDFFGEVDYCCSLHTIPANYFEAISSIDLNNWILAMKREFDFLVENNTFEWQKAPKK